MLLVHSIWSHIVLAYQCTQRNQPDWLYLFWGSRLGGVRVVCCGNNTPRTIRPSVVGPYPDWWCDACDVVVLVRCYEGTMTLLTHPWDVDFVRVSDHAVLPNPFCGAQCLEPRWDLLWVLSLCGCDPLLSSALVIVVPHCTRWDLLFVVCVQPFVVPVCTCCEEPLVNFRLGGNGA